MYCYAYNCVSPISSDELDYIIDNMREIKANTFLNKISLDEINNSLMYGMSYNKQSILKDWSIGFYSIRRNNINAYILRNSCIEYVFKCNKT
jgi:hypothetical protein